MPRVPGDVPQVPFQPTQMPGYAAPAVQPAQNFFPQQLQQLAAGVQDLGQASSRIGSAMQREEIANKEQAVADQKQQDREREQQAREQERIQAKIQQERDRVNDTEAKSKVNEYRKFAITTRTEFGRLEGAGAAQQYGEYTKKLKDYGDELDKSLSNDDVRAMYRAQRDIFEFDTTNWMDSHAYVENRKYQQNTRLSSSQINAQDYTDSIVDETKNARLDVAKNILGIPTPRIRSDAYLAALKDDIRAAMEGQPEESIKVEIDKALKVTHANTLEALAASKEYAGINKYISSYKKEIDPKVASQYWQIATEALDTFDATKIAIGIAAPFRDADGFLSDENYAQVVSEMQRRYASKELKVSEDKLNKILSSLLSIKQSDSSLRIRAESELVQQASNQIEFQKSFEARNGYALWVDQTQRQSVAEQFGASIADGPIEDPAVIPIVSDDAENAMEAFRRTNPVLHARLAAAGKLKDLEDNLKGGGKSDPDAVLEIEDAINRDPNFLSSFPMEKFQSEYGLKLSREQYSSYVNKMLAARNKAASDADALSEGSQNLILNEALHSNGYANIDGTVDEEGKDKTKSKAVAATRADFRIQWDKYSASYRSSNSGKEPGRKEYKEFTDSYFADRKNTAIDKPVADITAQDLDTIVATHRDEKSGKVYASPLSQIDETLRNKAIARANDLNKNRVVVMVGGAPLERFATRTEAQNFIDSGKAKSLALYRNVTSTEFSIGQAGIISTAANSTELGSLALEMLANGDYAFEGSPLAAPDSDIRTNNIINFYLQKRSDARASPNIFIRGAMALGSSMEYAFEDKTFGQLNAQKVEQYKKTGEQSFVEFSKRIESIRDDVNDGDYPLNSRIDLGEVGDVSYALTGYNTEKLVQLGALKPVFKKTNVEWLEGGLDYYATTPKFNELVQETYSYTVTKLKKQEIRK